MHMLRALLALAVLICVALSASVNAAEAESDCLAIDDDAARLACYDQANGRSRSSLGSKPERAALPPAAPPASAPKPVNPSFAEVWELEAEHKRGTFHLLPYRANYLLPIQYSNSPNASPASPALNHSVSTDYPLSATEVKFQLSFKFKAWENIFQNNGDLWFGYTQQSYWQLYNDNDAVSAAFRETNYEPEGFLALRTDRDVLGWHWRMLNLGFVHQSNGRELPLSRSWNRIYADFGLERNDFVLSVRPWYRIPESGGRDDNPDIRDYMGSGDVRLSYIRDGHIYSILARHSLIGGRGALQLDWAYPISNSLKGYVQIFSGYGESLIDYNHSQTTLGIGILLVPW